MDGRGADGGGDDRGDDGGSDRGSGGGGIVGVMGVVLELVGQ